MLSGTVCSVAEITLMTHFCSVFVSECEQGRQLNADSDVMAVTREQVHGVSWAQYTAK